MNKAQHDKPKQVSLDDIILFGRVAVNRAYAFAALSRKVKGIDIPTIDLGRACVFNLISQEVWNERQDAFKEGFEEWVASKCIEDMVESFEYVMNSLYDILPINTDSPSRFQKNNFKNNQSMKDKLKTLKKIGIEVEHSDSIETLVQVRKCLTHRQGFVGSKDIQNQGGRFTVKWYCLDGRAVGMINGERQAIPMITAIDTRQFDAGCQLNVEIIYAMREKTLQDGQRIVFTAHEIQEICFTITRSIDSLAVKFINKLEEFGVEIIRTPSPPDESGVNETDT